MCEFKFEVNKEEQNLAPSTNMWWAGVKKPLLLGDLHLTGLLRFFFFFLNDEEPFKTGPFGTHQYWVNRVSGNCGGLNSQPRSVVLHQTSDHLS